MAWRLVGVLLLCLAGPTRAQPVGEAFAAPVAAADGTVTTMQARLCRPVLAGMARLVVIAHGSPAIAAARQDMTLTGCGAEAVRWFTSRGYAVAVFLRRGYGATGGAYAEGSGACAEVDYPRAGLETARDLAAAVEMAMRLPGVRPDGAIVVGQSAGGWGALAYDSQPHPKVAAFVSMAGGRGGHVGDQPHFNCRPDALAEAAGRYGATATTPMLWIYTANDSYFAPVIAADMHARFTAAGGRAEFHQLDAFGTDGHRLFYGSGGSAIWGPLVADYLARMNLPPH